MESLLTHVWSVLSSQPAHCILSGASSGATGRQLACDAPNETTRDPFEGRGQEQEQEDHACTGGGRPKI